jgi:hypothetical protein
MTLSAVLRALGSECLRGGVEEPLTPVLVPGGEMVVVKSVIDTASGREGVSAAGGVLGAGSESVASADPTKLENLNQSLGPTLACPWPVLVFCGPIDAVPLLTRLAEPRFLEVGARVGLANAVARRLLRIAKVRSSLPSAREWHSLKSPTVLVPAFSSVAIIM